MRCDGSPEDSGMMEHTTKTLKLASNEPFWYSNSTGFEKFHPSSMSLPHDEQKFTAIASYLIGLQAVSLHLCHAILCFWWIICNIRESARFPKVSFDYLYAPPLRKTERQPNSEHRRDGKEKRSHGATEGWEDYRSVIRRLRQDVRGHQSLEVCSLLICSQIPPSLLRSSSESTDRFTWPGISSVEGDPLQIL
jgi:hypothetical protein